MRTLPAILLCLLFLAVPRATAQETFTPLISENCVAFVHVDFSKIELNNVKTALQKTGEHVLKKLGFDEKSSTATARELSIELEKLDMFVRPTWEILTKKLGITEVALVINSEFFEEGMEYFVIAIPWKNKTNEQFEKLQTLLHAPEDGILQIDGFLLLPNRARSEALTDWAKSIKPAPATSPIHEALKSVADADIRAYQQLVWSYIVEIVILWMFVFREPFPGGILWRRLIRWICESEC